MLVCVPHCIDVPQRGESLKLPLRSATIKCADRAKSGLLLTLRDLPQGRSFSDIRDIGSLEIKFAMPKLFCSPSQSQTFRRIFVTSEVSGRDYA